MSIRTVRRICQVFFVVLALWFCVVNTLGTAWWQLRGWPVNWLLQLDPLVALGTLLTTRTVYAGLLWALATIGLTILLGRFFCGWVCPFGSIHQFTGYLGRRSKRFADRVAANQYRPGQAIKYYLLIFLLTAAAGHLLYDALRVAHDRPVIPGLVLAAGLVAIALLTLRNIRVDRKCAVIGLVVLVGAWVGLGFFVPVRFLVNTSLQTGLLDPIPLFHRSINLVLLPLADSAGKLSVHPRYYDGAWLIGGVFLAAILLNLVVPRFYCRIICPLGALLGVLSRWAWWRIGKTGAECTECELCEDNCEGACQPFEKVRISECLLCMNCRDACHQKQVRYQPQPSAAGEITSPAITRRRFVIAAATGAVAGPMLRLSGLLGPNWRPTVIRPPGALAEDDFLDRCIKCGQCMRICPTNIIHPAGLEAGLEGVWSPLLNFRIGTSGCQLNCVACGQICPTAAIRPLSLDEKLGRNGFAAAGPIRMGTAFVDRGRCLPWAMDKPCIVCQENCPVSPKAIYLREEFQTLRDGSGKIQRVDGDAIEWDGNPFAPGRLATGDYYGQWTGPAGPRRRRIVENTDRRLVLAADGDGQRPAAGEAFDIQVRLQRPYVDPKLCIGCGICEHECPVNGLRAIRVSAENESRNRKRAMVL